MTLSHEMRNRFFDELCNDKSLMWMGQNTNHFDPHPQVLTAIQASLDSGEYHIYAPPLGLEELRELIIKDVGIPTASTMVTNGAVEGLYNICSLFNVPGKDFITTDPSWAWPMNFAKRKDANVIQVPIYGPEGNYKLNIEYLKAVISDKTQMIYVVDPNNPLGTCHNEDEIRQIAEIAKSANAYLIHDSTYSHFAKDYVPAYDFYPDKTFVIYSFSKWLGLAGMRLGAVIASPENIALLASSPPNNLGCNIVAQRAAIAGLKTKSEWFPTVLQRLARNQKCVYEAVEKIPGLHIPVYPSQANFLVIETEAAGLTPESLVSAYKDLNIMIRQGEYHTKEFGHKFVKISLTVPEAWVDKFCEHLPAMVKRAQTAGAESVEALF